jgi:proline iminopeptidase
MLTASPIKLSAARRSLHASEIHFCKEIKGRKKTRMTVSEKISLFSRPIDRRMKYILKTVAVFFLFLANTCTFGQRLDSIQYANGYLYYHSYGNGEPIIILSGGPGVSCEQVEDVAIKMSKNYRAILFEQRGTGRSMPVPFDSTTITLKNAQADLILLLNHLKLKKAIFLGHSWGAGLSLSFAVNFPDRVKSILLIDIGPFKDLHDLRETVALNRNVRYGKFENKILDSLHLKIKAGTMTNKDSSEYRKEILLSYIYEKDSIEKIFMLLAKGKINYQTQTLMINDLDRIKFDLAKKLLSVRSPVYAICGRQDPFAFCTYELKIALPKTQLFWIQKSGHFPMYEQPDNFYKVLDEIMEKEKNSY